MGQLILIGVGLTVALVLFVGVFVGRRVEGDSQNFLVAGRNMPIYLVAPALMAAAVDSNAIVGNADLSSAYGFWGGASLAIGMAISLVLCGILVAKPLNSMGLFSLDDFFRIKYGRAYEKLASALTIITYLFLYAGNMVACGTLLQYFLGIPYVAGLVVAGCLVLAYTMSGGLYSDAYTAAIQVCITIFACVLLSVFVGLNWGFHTPEEMGPFDFGQLTMASAGAAVNWATLASLGFGEFAGIDFGQRWSSAKSPNTARNACFLAAAITAAIGIAYSMISLTATQEFGPYSDESPVLYQFLSGEVPPIVTVVVLAGVVAASFSTASGAILGMSNVIIRNVAGFRRNYDASHKDPQLRLCRLCMIPLSLAGMFIAARIAQTGILLTLAFDLMMCCLTPALIGGLYWKRSSTRAVFASTIVGATVRIVFFVLTPVVYGADNTLLYIPNDLITADADGWSTFISFGLSLATYGVVCALCPRTDEDNEREAAEVEVLREERETSAEALYRRAVLNKRKDTLDFYESAKRAGFPVEGELQQAREALTLPIGD
jgi:SSS family solute:Na+ symporter